MKNQTTKILLFSFVILVTAGILASYFTLEDEREKLVEKAVQLEQELQERDFAYNEIIDIMYAVESKIESIKDRESFISETSSGEFDRDEKNRMIDDMNSIDQLIIETNEKVSRLSSKLEKTDINLKSFQNRVAALSTELQERKVAIGSLRQELKNRDIQIADMSIDLSALEYQVGEQESTIATQATKIDLQEDELSKAYFAMGTKEALKEDGLVTQEGGVLWFGKTTEIKANLDQEKFSEIDIWSTKRLYVDSKKIDLVTEHPSDSYELVKEGDSIIFLEIKDPKEFWKISKYLVVATKS